VLVRSVSFEVQTVLLAMGRWVPNAYNSYLQALVEIEILVAASYVVWLMPVVLLAEKLFIRDTSEEVLIILMLLGMLFIFGFLESSFFNGQQINWFALVFRLERA